MSYDQVGIVAFYVAIGVSASMLLCFVFVLAFNALHATLHAESGDHLGKGGTREINKQSLFQVELAEREIKAMHNARQMGYHLSIGGLNPIKDDETKEEHPKSTFDMSLWPLSNIPTKSSNGQWFFQGKALAEYTGRPCVYLRYSAASGQFYVGSALNLIARYSKKQLAQILSFEEYSDEATIRQREKHVYMTYKNAGVPLANAVAPSGMMYQRNAHASESEREL